MLEPGLLYFAYGCNMNPGRLGRVLGRSVRKGSAATAAGWRLAFTKGGEGREGDSVTATIVPDSACVIYGVIYRIPGEALRSLDRFEAVPEHYRRERIRIEPLGRRAVQGAVTYVAQPDWIVEPGHPDRDYLREVLEGARQHGLPASYIEWLSDLAAGRASGCFPLSDDERAIESHS